MSYADQIFIQNCNDILEHGVWDTDYDVRPVWEDGTPAHTIKRFGIVNRYDLTREFPVITLRRTAFKSAVDELLWIWQKKSNNIHHLNSHIWDSWVDRILYDLKHNPLSRRIMSNIYNHHDLCEMNLYPCAYSMTFNVSGNTLNGILNQRSQDMLTANSWNVCQYAVLLHMLAQVSGLKPGELVHVIADAHIYDRHIPMVQELLKREPYPGPTLSMDTSIQDFYKFTTDSFRLENYQYHTFSGKIPVAI